MPTPVQGRPHFSASRLRKFDRDGYLVVRNALDRQTIASLIDASDRVMASGVEYNRETQDVGWDSYRNSIALDGAYYPLLTWHATFPLVVQILGPNIHLLSSQLIYLYPIDPSAPRLTHVPGNSGWHRDISGTARDLGHENVPRLAVKVAYYLTDARTTDSGMTKFLPGSHLLKREIDISPDAIDPVGAIQPRIVAGDAVIFENRTWHAIGLNSGDATRKCVILQYGFRWLRPVDYRSQPVQLIDWCGPLELQLLGETEDRDDMGRMAFGRGAEPLRQWVNQRS